ncbi:MAG: hypothetical protein D3917_17805 [Candidatus Electrothrix sp. AX5]|nr:hypothetical protein [Candidatus Electrothrix sp. AX5]
MKKEEDAVIPGRRMQVCSCGGYYYALQEYAGMLLRRMQACSSGGCRYTPAKDSGAADIASGNLDAYPDACSARTSSAHFGAGFFYVNYVRLLRELEGEMLFLGSHCLK